ncbi:MAG TPA: sigma 54-interacting transcriptional regulator [Pyrinomonadaceae bacterium]|nr:sigma 54-interacting transcriptional regulator [Pyrinomonadaceae bacterium]
MADALRREGRDVLSACLDGKLAELSLPEDVIQGVLIQLEQGVITIGEQTNRVRGILGEKREMLLCCPQPTPSDRETLMECGANNIATPASWISAHVAERILAEIIVSEGTEGNTSGPLYGGTEVMRDLYRDITRLAPLDDAILILGETGTGKELVANELHRQSGREDKLMPINCAELSPELLGSELFGHEKGAFTNALQARRGLLVDARKRSVLLDEIGDLDLQAQAKLLRLIEEHKVRPVGSNRWIEVEARLILATNRNLEEESRVGKFRRDLRERIRGFTLVLPPLRERKADLPLLAQHFVAEYSHDYGQKLDIPPGALDCLFRYDWEGNVRELRAVIRKASAYADSNDNISAVMLQESIIGRKKNIIQNSVHFDPASDSWRDVQKRMQAAYLRAVLIVANGNKETAARLSGLSRAQLYEKIKEID